MEETASKIVEITPRQKRDIYIIYETLNCIEFINGRWWYIYE